MLPEPPYGFDDAPSAFAKAMGLEIAHWEPGLVRLEAPIAPWHLNRTSVIHGGIAAAMIDMACGFAGIYSPPGDPPRHALTLSLTVNFTGQTSTGRLVAEGRVKKAGRRVYFTEATLEDDKGQMLAFGTGVFRYRTGS
ncbi:MAG: PaaI family thioesterase [Geminicoccaceae bacterium]|nr:MAG: PaaI family thioesterase [Geminicoccaceae bacterium]